MREIYYYIDIDPMTGQYKVYPVETRFKNLPIYKFKTWYESLEVAQSICNNFNYNIDLL